MPNGHQWEEVDEYARELRMLKTLATAALDRLTELAETEEFLSMRPEDEEKWWRRIVEGRADLAEGEAEEARRAKLRESALAKLTPEEREALR